MVFHNFVTKFWKAGSTTQFFSRKANRFNQKEKVWAFSGGSVEKNLPGNAGDGLNP